VTIVCLFKLADLHVTVSALKVCSATDRAATSKSAKDTYIETNYIQRGPKNRLFLRVDNFLMVNVKKACDVSKVLEFCFLWYIFAVHEIMLNLTKTREYLKYLKEYLNALACKFHSFSRHKLDNFDISYTFLLLTVGKLSTLKNSPFFDPSCISSNCRRIFGSS